MISPQRLRDKLDARIEAYMDKDVRPRVAALLEQANRRAHRHRIVLRQGMGTWSFFVDGGGVDRLRDDNLTDGCQGCPRNDRAERYAARFPELVKAASLIDDCYELLESEVGDIGQFD